MQWDGAVRLIESLVWTGRETVAVGVVGADLSPSLRIVLHNMTRLYGAIVGTLAVLLPARIRYQGTVARVAQMATVSLCIPSSFKLHVLHHELSFHLFPTRASPRSDRLHTRYHHVRLHTIPGLFALILHFFVACGVIVRR